jgi:5-methyltetrahydrofolate--homocysteine methyltransferase
MLRRVIEGRWLAANGAVGFWPANAKGDDIVLWTDETRAEPALVWRNLRQQAERPPGKPHQCLADFVGPRGTRDYVGAFAVTAGSGSRRSWRSSPPRATTTGGLMLKAIADRWPRRSPNGCTGACAPSSGATRPARRFRSRR